MSKLEERESRRRSATVGKFVEQPPMAATSSGRRGRPKEDRELKKRISLSVLPSVYEDIQKIAYVQRRSVSELIGELLEGYRVEHMLNANTSTWNCDVYTSNSDTYVNFEKVSTGVYYIRLKSHPERYLTAGGTKSGSDVSWEKLSTTTAGKKAQQWKVTATSLPTVYTRVTSGADSLGDDQMETNAEYIYNYLKKKGFTKNAICGILGNMNSESTINPAVWQSLNDMYLGYGLVQWDDGKLFIDWAKKEGVISAATAEAVNSLAYSNPKKLMDAELDYLIVSMNTVGNWFKPDNNQSKYGTSETLTASQFKVSNKSADILARIFCGHYERPGVPKISERVANAKKWYNFL